MCMECRQNPCHPRCPNAPEPVALYRCVECNKRIYDGDEYYRINGDPYCESCVYHCSRVAGDDE